MMVDCPKCGFSQPNDRYCAQCGVDMASFKPKPEPILQRIRKSLWVQVSVVVLIIAALFLPIYLSQKEAIENQIKMAFEPSLTPPPGNETLTAEPIPAEAPAEQETQTFASPAANFRQTQEDEDDRTSPHISSLEVSYWEAPQALVQIWASEGQVLGQSGEIKSILLSNLQSLSSLKRNEWTPESLPGGRSHTLSSSGTVREDHFRAAQGLSGEAGFVLDIDPNKFDDEQFEFEFQMVVTLPSGMDGSLGTSTASGRYIIPKNSALVIIGTLPRQSLRGEAANAFTGTPLSVLQSPDFQSGATEFALVLRPQ